MTKAQIIEKQRKEINRLKAKIRIMDKDKYREQHARDEFDRNLGIEQELEKMRTEE